MLASVQRQMAPVSRVRSIAPQPAQQPQPTPTPATRDSEPVPGRPLPRGSLLDLSV